MTEMTPDQPMPGASATPADPRGATDGPLVRVEGLYKVFGPDPRGVLDQVKAGRSKADILAETGHTVGLKDINLTIDKGRIYVVMGLSGSGKSTLIRHFNRLIDPTDGRILIDGTDVMALSPRELEQFRRHKMSMVFQRFGLMPHRKVLDNIGYGLQVQGVPRAERLAKARHWLEAVGLEGYEGMYPAQLSGGQQQRVGLARALCTDADILLMDEAFSALDPLIRSEMQDQLIALQEKLHKTIIFITHDLDEALRLGDRIAILKDGELVQEGAPVDILLRPATDYVKAFVKDVNRARALTVDTVMKPPSHRITAETIGEALEQMKGHKGDYGYYFNDDGYQGVVSQKALEEAARADANAPLNEAHWEDSPAVTTGDLIEQALPGTLDAEYPLAVLDENGELVGQLPREALAEVLTYAEEVAAEDPEKPTETAKV
ncbi:quaternary amine ABC transporter ATP-binding protein [Roseospirillum parvum]|uniref:Quaternary amine transport ATP-binding protein n=1 Tax=Roseospirillum parvum TaxID=83401 RepID=A0A1G8BLD6_9PROT|nr:glycine betaine/L-proline ABC transporter ATP-binding protein [Roseospirillum parvum]SDH34049.1 glycine betaine/proline transport system ATP-binding protein [Roseospirillum parvum]